jgi:hypothetical protein
MHLRGDLSCKVNGKDGFVPLRGGFGNSQGILDHSVVCGFGNELFGAIGNILAQLLPYVLYCAP